MTKEYSYYIAGRTEGYFNIRLEPILEEKQDIRIVFAKGYQLGKKTRQIEELKETEEENALYQKKRRAYIINMGYRSANSLYPYDSSQLKGDDKAAFDEGYQAAVLYKEQKQKAMDEIREFRNKERIRTTLD